MSIEDEMRESMDAAIRSLAPGMMFRAKALRQFADILIACDMDDIEVMRAALRVWLEAQSRREDESFAQDPRPAITEVTQYWLRHYRAPDGLCALCGNSGILISHNGWGGQCVCPNGQSTKEAPHA